MEQEFRSALSHAERVDAALVVKKYAGWGSHFEREFLKGLRLVVDGSEKGDGPRIIAGQMLILSWDNWYNANCQGLRKALR